MAKSNRKTGGVKGSSGYKRTAAKKVTVKKSSSSSNARRSSTKCERVTIEVKRLKNGRFASCKGKAVKRAAGRKKSK